MNKRGKGSSQSREGIFLVENRKNPRVSVEFPFDYSLIDGKEAQRGIVADASEGGLLIYLSEKVDVGAFLRIEILLGKPIRPTTIKAIGRVVWADLTEYCYGVQFLSFFEGDLHKLKMLLREIGQIGGSSLTVGIDPQEGMKQNIVSNEEIVEIAAYDVLVVGNEKGLRNRVATLLFKRGHQCLPADDGADAMGIAYTKKFDAVITDVLMPKMDGIALTKQLLKRTPDLPILVMTPHDNELSPVTAIAAGAREFIRKPFSLTELAIRFDKMMTDQAIPPEVEARQKETFFRNKRKSSEKINDLQRKIDSFKRRTRLVLPQYL